ncbi:MAG: EamA family transporter [Candidatus Aenigmarchaeota archaeon]|nr:EamA family transporter [Candidatus Aenigmarchaeota archaeon]
MEQQHKGILSIILSALLFGSMGILVRLIDVEVPPFSQVLFRAIISIGLLVIFLLPKNKDFFKIKKNDLLYYFIGGVFGYGLMLILFTLSLLNTTIANTFFLLFTEPFFVIIIGYFFLKEKISKKILIAILLCFFGIFFILNPTSIGNNLIGNLYGLGAGFFYAIYILIGKYMGRKYSSSTNTLWTFLFALLFLIPVTFLFENPSTLSISPNIWFLLFLFGAINFSAYILLNVGLRKITAGHVSILLLFEPVSSIIYAFLFFGEIPNLSTIIGSFLIILGILYLSINNDSKKNL